MGMEHATLAKHVSKIWGSDLVFIGSKYPASHLITAIKTPVWKNCGPFKTRKFL